MQQHGSSGLGQPSPGSPRNALYTAAVASAIWHSSSSSPEPPQRSASPTRLGGRFSRGPGPPSRQGSPRKSLLQSPKQAKQHQEKANEVGLPAAVLLAFCSTCQHISTPGTATPAHKIAFSSGSALSPAQRPGLSCAVLAVGPFRVSRMKHLTGSRVCVMLGGCGGGLGKGTR